jgi:hypothetical protein
MSRLRQHGVRVVALLLALVLTTAVALADEGKVVEKYDDGKTRAEYLVGKDGKKNGFYREFYPEGKLKVRAVYRNGELNGAYTEFDEKGKPAKVAEYREGKLVGAEKTFDKSGGAAEERGYIGGVLIYPKSKTIIRQTLQKIENAAVPGATDSDSTAAIRRIMVYRFLCDLPYEGMSSDPQLHDAAEAAAEICAKIGHLTHTPDNPGWPDARYKLAAHGASHSNLYFDSGGVRPDAAIDGFMDDSDPTNIDRLGHRRWILNPGMLKTAYGTSGNFAALYAMDSSRPNAGTDFAAYPPRGYMVSKLFSPHHAWSLSLNPQKYEVAPGATVSVWAVGGGEMKTIPAPAGNPMELNYMKIERGGFGVALCIIFRPTGVSVTPGSRYWVSIDGVTLKVKGGNIKAEKMEYLVEFM